MNEAFFNFAKERLESLSPAEIKAAAEKHGLKLISKYAGQLLSLVPYEDIWVGMEVVGCNFDEGKIVELIQDSQSSIRIEWKRTATTCYPHNWHNTVTVSDK